MSTRKILWQDLKQKYLDGLACMSLPQDYLDKIDSLMLSTDTSSHNQGIELILSTSPEYICRFLDFENDYVKLNDSYSWASYQHVEAMFLDAVKREPTAQKLYDSGAFESIEFRCFGDKSLDELSETEQAFCVRLSKGMAHLPAGEFMMGGLDDDHSSDPNEYPRHKVVFTKELLVGKYPVTQALWEDAMGSNPSRFKGANHPVEQVSWFDCVLFCNKLSEMEDLEAVYDGLGDYQVGDDQNMDQVEIESLSARITCNWNAKGYRLPTEAEWEYAARGGEYHEYSGSDNIDEVAWYADNSERSTHSVGLKKPNGFGIYDMSGSIMEWCWDLIDCEVINKSEGDIYLKSGSQYQNTTRVNPQGPSKGFYRIGRGGCLFYNSSRIRVSFRCIEIEDDSNDPQSTACGGGVRIVRSIQ